MTRWYITMGGSKYDDITDQAVRDAPNMGADMVLVYDDVWVSAHPFRQLNAWLWDHPGDRNGKIGFGWHAWKPLLILHTFERYARPGDVVLYVDADTRPVANFSVIYEIARRDGAMFFKSQGHSNHRWNKADCLEVMAAREAQMRDAGCARFCAFQCGDWRATQFLYEWLTYSVNPRANTRDPSVLASEHAELNEHRTEQAIMTNLVHRYGYRMHRECDQSGNESNEDRDLYPQLFVQRNSGDCVNGPGSRFRNVELP
jgi:hypothetical protein